VAPVRVFSEEPSLNGLFLRKLLPRFEALPHFVTVSFFVSVFVAGFFFFFSCWQCGGIGF